MGDDRARNNANRVGSTRFKSVEQRLHFDAAALEQYLAAHMEGLHGPFQVAQFEGGQSNPTYLLSARCGHRLVLRRKPPGTLLPSAHDVAREFAVTRARYSTGFPVARPRLLSEDESVIGTALFVGDYVERRIFWGQTLPGLTKEVRAAVWREMCQTVAALHKTDYRAADRETFGRPGNYCEHQITRWSKQYRASEAERVPAMDNLIEWLPRNITPQTSDSIAHGDFRLNNMIFHPTEPKVLAVLDWKLSTLGDPLADFAYNCLSWHVLPGQFRGIAGLVLGALGLPTEQEHVARDCLLTGRDGIEPAYWDFYIASNLFHIAAIPQGTMKRAVEGTAASAKALDNGRRAVHGRTGLEACGGHPTEAVMNFGHSEKVEALHGRLQTFMADHIHPNEKLWQAHTASKQRWKPLPIVGELKVKAWTAGYLWRPKSLGGTLSNNEYAPLCEIMGRVHWAPEVFNCSAPAVM